MLDHDPEATLDRLREWAGDPSVDVRRLVSEGTRPRLPWAPRLQRFIDDPTPVVELLELLKDVPEDYVRRSVANNLNDIAKDHPAVVAKWLEDHLPGADKERRALLKHASRTLIKRGDRRILKAWGMAGALRGEVTFAVKPKQAKVGESVILHVDLRSTAKKPEDEEPPAEEA